VSLVFKYNRLINKETYYLKIFTVIDIFKVLGGLIASFAIFQSPTPFFIYIVIYVVHALKFRLNEPPGAFNHWVQQKLRERVRRPGHSEIMNPVRSDYAEQAKPQSEARANP
jgi:hypothetical protein